MSPSKTALFPFLLVAGTGCKPAADATPMMLEPSIYRTEEELGEALFFDTNLSMERTQACATCHDPERAFTDGRLGDDGRVRAVSLGDDGVSLGDRNAPSAAYALLAPEFHYGTRARENKHNQNRLYEGALGGQFWDGRAPGLAAQAGGPPLNPLEMGMPDQTAVVERISEDEEYLSAFIELYGEDVFDTDEQAYGAMAGAVAAFERTEVFAPFDSRYDRSLTGELALSFKELTGKAVFFSQFGNCSICHQLYSEGDPINERREPFSGFEYHNIGVPVNEAVRQRNGVAGPDVGLLANPESAGDDERGKFKVPTLRNVAVTGPYMHNGVFQDLRTVVEFYDRHNNEELRALNPETGEPWRDAEIPETVATELLDVGDPLTDLEIEGLVCFMRALTDQRYEALIEPGAIDCSD
ncbi:MAG: cytochrome c peroxidase [Myxococcota bacterium]